MNAATSVFLERGNPELQDRVEILWFGEKVVLIVADGAGGRSGGAQAAELFVPSAREAAASLAGPQDCSRLLCELDQKIAVAHSCGETTGVIVVLCFGTLFGASVGDSAAWLFTRDGKEELTRVRKPYLGAGVAAPHQFERELREGTVVVASDGLWKYASLEFIEQKVRMESPNQLAERLGDLARLRTGAFQDDVAIAVCHLGTEQ